MFSDDIYNWLEGALDIGIKESEFWEMTFAELQRAFDSKARVVEREQKIKATFDYILADAIGRSIGRLYSSSNKMPAISELYPSLYKAEEEQELIQQRKDELSALRFKLFAEAFNNNFKEVAKVNE